MTKPFLDPRSYPKSPIAAQDIAFLYNDALDPNASEEQKQKARQGLQTFIVRGPESSYAYFLVRTLHWYDAHPEVNPEPIRIPSIPRFNPPPARRVSRQDPDPPSMWDF